MWEISVLALVGFVVLVLWYLSQHQTDERAPLDKAQTSTNRINPNISRVTARFQEGQIRAATDHTNLLTDQATAMAGAHTAAATVKEAQAYDESTYARIDKQAELNEAIHQQQLADSGLMRQLILNAGIQGVDVPTMLEIIRRQAFDEADINKLEKELSLRLTSALRLQLVDFGRLQIQGNTFDLLIEERYKIEVSDKSELLKDKLLEEKDKDIEHVRQTKQATRDRLLQSSNGTNVQGEDDYSDH